jgi:hypothetical protein
MNLRRIPWIRLVLGIGCVTVALSYADKAVAQQSMPNAMFAASSLVAGGILIGSTFVKTASKPFLGFIDRVYFGGETVEDAPPLNLKLARAYRSERCFDRCIEECGRQLEHHSLAPELWAELLLAHREAGHRVEEAATLERALRCLGMEQNPNRFAKIVRDRDNLPHIAAGLMSQFNR